MAQNIFERYGIKEVANVYFEALENDQDGHAAGDIVLYLDTLKVSTIETTAENVSAQGGWGNPKLVTWDYGKDITVQLEDAVIAWEEMKMLLGAKSYAEDNEDNRKIIVRKTKDYTWTKNDLGTFANGLVTGKGGVEYGKHNFPTEWTTKLQNTVRWINLDNGERGNSKNIAASLGAFFEADANATAHIRYFWQEEAAGDGSVTEANELVISPDRFPGTYRVVGDALIRSEKNNMDDAFQFVINKAKLLSEVTLTMQADGDPSTFNMSLQVLRDSNGEMMSLIKY